MSEFSELSFMLDEIVDTGSDFDVRFRDGSSMPVDYDATVAQLLEQMRVRREATLEAFGHPELSRSNGSGSTEMGEFSELSFMLDEIVDAGSDFDVRFRDGSSMPVDYDATVAQLLEQMRIRREATENIG